MPGGFERLADLETAPTPKIPPDGFAMGITPPAEIAAGSADRTTVAFMDNGCERHRYRDADGRLRWKRGGPGRQTVPRRRAPCA